jgi:adenine-specific DNA-methyltransferase
MSSPTALPPIAAVTAGEPDAQSANPVTANIQALKELFPDAVSEGGVDFDVLRQLLGDAVDDGEEKYGLNWSGKRRARRLALTPSLGTLLPAPGDSVDWATTKNLMIEGDNLEVLKLLQKSYAGKVKLIYIDPPYNTGNDFVYPDDYADSLSNYLRRTGQIAADGLKNTTNAESGGRYHTDWLNMMLPRLMLARDLLSNHGMIAISIDDNEVSRLRELLDHVFGVENFIATVIWQKVFSPKNSAMYLSEDHDYICLYARDANSWRPRLLPRTAEMEARYNNPDSDARGPWTSGDLSARNFYGEGNYAVTTPSGREISGPPPGTYWRVSAKKMDELNKDNRIWWGANGENVPRLKRFLSEVREGKTPQTLWFHSDVGNTQESKKELISLVDARNSDDVFDTPKPTRLIRRLLEICTSPNSEDIVVDFFAGSGTTGHAVMAQNADDGGQRRFVLVQLPEPLSSVVEVDGSTRLLTISDLTKERLRRAASKVKIDTPITKADLGFRAYRLATSNVKTWAPGDDLEADLLSAADNLVPGRTEDDLLVELLLKRGIDLVEPSDTREIAGRTVHAFGGGVMLACLGDVQVADAEVLADGIADWVESLSPVAPAMIFFKDAGFENDVAKTNVAKILDQRLNGRGPGEAHLLEAVRSV